ncbi:hypothetical protein B0H14DRAFT_3171518 [Mycena olivaceomarginata]|nr:hypothetical protein B0H14DRAFT_3171518 [Mycena olivaceomarginata]
MSPSGLPRSAAARRTHPLSPRGLNAVKSKDLLQGITRRHSADSASRSLVGSEDETQIRERPEASLTQPMQLFVFLSQALLAAVRAAVVAAHGSSVHFHSPIPLAPQGKNITINGVLTYVSLPKGEYDLTVAVLMFIGGLTSHSVLEPPFGNLPSPDNLADQWAAAGFAVGTKLTGILLSRQSRLHQTYVPDYLNSDIFPTEGNINVTERLAKHGESQTTPPLLVVINALKSHGVKQMDTVLVSCAPVQINRAELDPGFTPALAVETDAVLGDGQYAPGYLRRQFDGVGHGFAVRANAVAMKQGAFDASLVFTKKHLK